MDIQRYLKTLIKGSWIIALLVVITACSAYFFSTLQRPLYRSTAYLNAIPVQLAEGVQLAIQQQLRNYGGQIMSDSTLQRVNDELQLDMPPDMMRSRMSIDSSESDLLIEISVEDYDPQITKEIADKTADVFVSDVRVQMQDQDAGDRIRVWVRDYAHAGSIIKPKRALNVLIGALLGGLLGVLVVFFLAGWEANLIRSAEEMQRSVGVAVLGLIPRATAQSRRPLWLRKL